MFLSIGSNAAIPYRYLTRHMGIFGATGTGKTTTLGAIAERAPCPVLILDAKGDLESLQTSIMRPRMSISDIGPDLIARALNLSEAQAGIVQIAMAWAQDTGRRVDTLADLRGLLNDALYADLSAEYGLISKLSVSATQRALLRLERGASWAFGARRHDARDTQGRVVYACSGLTALPGLYGAFVAHVLETLYSGLGEIGDVAAPGLLVMIDEAHLVFDGATPAIVQRIEQITRLIRSKGVGLIFVTQAPSDLPNVIAGQLATRIQHALRGATAQHMKALRAAAETMPGNIAAGDIMGLGTGEAIASIPDAKGVPLPGRKVKITRGNIALQPIDWQDVPEPPRVEPLGTLPDNAFAPPLQPEKTWLQQRSPWFWIWCIVGLIYALTMMT